LRIRMKVGEKAPDFRFDTPWQSSQDFYGATQHQSAILVFLRYHGCPVCQMEMAHLKREIGIFNGKDVRIFVFLQSAIQTLSPLIKEGDFPFTIVCDPEGKIFRLYAVAPGGLLKYFHPAGLLAFVKATGRGFIHKKFEGHETQLPAAFIIRPDKTIKYVHYGRHIGDVPKPSTLAANID
jgi:thioredoxin-dependent peroxiredoxin